MPNLEPPCSASFSFEIQQPPIWTNISRALRDFEAQTKAPWILERGETGL